MGYTDPALANIRFAKRRGQNKTIRDATPFEATVAGVGGPAIEGRFCSLEIRATSRECFVRISLPYGHGRNHATAEDYQ